MHPVEAPALPAPDVIRDTANQILAGPDYHLKPLGNDDLALLRNLWNAIKWILGPFIGLFDTLNAISPVLAIGYVIGLVLLAIALTWHIIYTFRVALRNRIELRGYRAGENRGMQPAELEDRARHAAERQDYITAVRYLFQACLLRLEQAEQRTFRKGATNREYLRRFQGTTAYEPLHCFVEIIDNKWYGQGRCERSDFDECRQAHAAILVGQRT